MSSDSKPNARTNTVNGILRVRSIRTYEMSFESDSYSNHAPRLGIKVAPYKALPFLSGRSWKYEPGERTN